MEVLPFNVTPALMRFTVHLLGFTNTLLLMTTSSEVVLALTFTRKYDVDCKLTL